MFDLFIIGKIIESFFNLVFGFVQSYLAIHGMVNPDVFLWCLLVAYLKYSLLIKYIPFGEAKETKK